MSVLRYLFWGKRTPRRFVFGVGLFTIGSTMYSWLKAPIMQNVREPLNLKVRYGADNYAVVAGAASPVGEAFCESLVRKGFKLILVDDVDRTEALDNLSSKYGDAPTFKFDFKNQTTWQEYEGLCKSI